MSLKKALYILLIIIFLVIIIGAYYLYQSINVSSEKSDDNARAISIGHALKSYINDSNDWDLNFGSRKTVGVNDLVLKLQQKIIINNKEYGPYLRPGYDNTPSLNKYTPKWTEKVNGKYKGWRISVHKGTENVYVKPSDKESEIIIDEM